MEKLIKYIINDNEDTDLMCLFDNDIFEYNEQMFPYKRSKREKFSIWYGEHGKEMMQKFNVSKFEIVNAFFAAWADLDAKFRKHEICVSKDGGVDNRFIIIDYRHDRNKPLCISAFIYWNYSPSRLDNPNFTVRTVFRGDDFSGIKRNLDDEIKIFLY